MTQTCEFTDFVRANTPALVRTAYLLTGDAHAAEELVQDTLVRLYPKWDRVAGADVPLAYVRRSLSNNFVNGRRRPAVRHELSTDRVPESGHEFGLDPAGRIDDRGLLWQLLATLPARQRTALVLRYYEELNDEEIAQVLECRRGTVRSLLSRGLAALRESEGLDVREDGRSA